MKDWPIIFSAPMIRALLDGRKTMTRRKAWTGGERVVDGVREPNPSLWQRVKPGDRLFVRESWTLVPDSFDGQGDQVYFPVHESTDFGRKCETDNAAFVEKHKARGIRWRPSIHMPRWASRLTLTVTATKIERLHDISERDAVLEGVYCVRRHENDDASPTQLFAMLWCKLHGDDSWNANPEVVALTFAVANRNIDQGETK